jgi:Cobalt transport protein
VAEAVQDRTKIAVLKVCYLLAVTAIAFAIPAFSATRSVQWIVIPLLLAAQVVILLACRVSVREIVRPPWRLKWLFIFLIAAYAFLPAEAASDAVLTWTIPGGWHVSINQTGLERAALMCCQIITVLLASAAVRLSGKGTDLVDGLQALRLPTLFVHSLDQTLELLGGVRRPGGGDGGGGGGGGVGGGRGREGGGGRGRGRAEQSQQLSFLAVLRRLLRGDVGAFVQAVQENIRVATDRTGRQGAGLTTQMAHDVAIVTGIALCMASLKILKFLPGIPFASGHKGLLLIPLYVLASRLTYSRWGGTTAGAIMGLIGFLQGDGRFGVLEILKHLAPGVLIDLTVPLVRRLPQGAVTYCILGLMAAVARTMTEFVVVLFLGARAEIYIFPAARLVPNLLAGFLSGFVTAFLLRAFKSSVLSIDKAQDAQAQPAPVCSEEASRQPEIAAGEELARPLLPSVSKGK